MLTARSMAAEEGKDADPQQDFLGLAAAAYRADHPELQPTARPHRRSLLDRLGALLARRRSGT